MNYKKDGYQLMKKAVLPELANFVYNYFLLKRKAVEWAYKKNIIQPTSFLGTWKDAQVPDTFCCYGDHAMETLLLMVLPRMQHDTGLKLVPTYSFARLYKKGDILHRHTDRPSCEVSTTIHLGGDKWPLFIDGTGGRGNGGTKVLLDVGDMLVYSGCHLEHWREPFEGDACAQVFLHYNHVDGPFAEKNRFDKRPMLGVPNLWD
jgi:hypothetical protein